MGTYSQVPLKDAAGERSGLEFGRAVVGYLVEKLGALAHLKISILGLLRQRRFYILFPVDGSLQHSANWLTSFR